MAILAVDKFCSVNNAAWFWACSGSVALLWLWSSVCTLQWFPNLLITIILCPHNVWTLQNHALWHGWFPPHAEGLMSKDRNILSCHAVMMSVVSLYKDGVWVPQGAHSCCPVPLLLGCSVCNSTNSVIYSYSCAGCAVEQYMALAADGVHPRVRQELR